MQGTGFLMGNYPTREHASGVTWRVTKKKRLIVLDPAGKELARYKDSRWLDVWLVEDSNV